MLGRMVVTIVVTLAAMGLIFPGVAARNISAEMIWSTPTGDTLADARQCLGKELVRDFLVASGCEEASAAHFAAALSPHELAFIADNPQLLQHGGAWEIEPVTWVLLAILLFVLILIETDTQEETGNK